MPVHDQGALGTCAIHALSIVVQEMLQMKYGRALDESAFVSTMIEHCNDTRVVDGVSPLQLVAEVNSRPHLEFEDACRKEAFQLRLESRRVVNLADLRRVLRLVPGTACAVAVITATSEGPVAEQGFHAVAAFREGYAESGTVVGRNSWGGRKPLCHFGEDEFQFALIIEPVIQRVFSRGSGCDHGELPIPSVSHEFSRIGTPFLEKTSHSSAKRKLLAQSCSSGASDAKSAAVLKPGPPDHVTEMMRRHADNPVLQMQACGALAALAQQYPRNRTAICSGGCVELVAAAMSRHADDADLQMWACSALATLAVNHAGNKSAIADAGAIQLITKAMQQHPGGAELQLWAIATMANLAVDHPPNQAAIARHGGIPLVTLAMRQHHHSAELLRWACGALANLAAKHPENQALIVSNAGKELIAAAARRHPGSLELQAWARAAIASLQQPISDASASGSAGNQSNNANDVLHHLDTFGRTWCSGGFGPHRPKGAWPHGNSHGAVSETGKSRHHSQANLGSMLPSPPRPCSGSSSKKQNNLPPLRSALATSVSLPSLPAS